MAVIKVACSKCGQKVSGDESFFGTSVDCPICTAKIYFPQDPNAPKQTYGEPPLPPVDESQSATASGGQPLPTPQDQLPAGALDSMPPTPLPPVGSDDPLADVPRRVSEKTPDRSGEDVIDLPSAGGGDSSFEGHESEGNNTGGEKSAHSSGDTTSEEDEEHSPALGATSLVFGILGVIFCNALLLLSPTAIICGHIALGRAKNSQSENPPGKQLALIGTILGYIGLVIGLIALAAFAIYVASQKPQPA